MNEKHHPGEPHHKHDEGHEHDHHHPNHEHGDHKHHSRDHEHHKCVVIIVEGTPHDWDKEEISYAQVVTLEVPDYPQHPDITYTVRWTHGPTDKPEGVLVPGASVHVRNDMRFYVSETGQS